MKVAIAQIAVAADPGDNLAQVTRVVEAAPDAALLVLPEGILARDVADPGIVRRSAQPLDGPFLAELRRLSRRHPAMTLTFCLHESGAPEGRVWNTHIALRDGEIVATYRKLHLYDAFATRESEAVMPGDALPPVIDVAGTAVGLMTCYDLRFPEVARHLAVAGAEVIALPAAWLRGPGKERHWALLCAARALENTIWLLGAGECGPRNIGASLAVDPLGVVVAQAGDGPALLRVEIDPDRTRDARARLPVLANRRFRDPELA